MAMSRSIQEPESVTGSEILEAAGRDGDEMPDSAECESTPNFRELSWIFSERAAADVVSPNVSLSCKVPL